MQLFQITKYFVLFSQSKIFIIQKNNNMLKLVSNTGRWALRDNSMIFSNVVWLIEEKDAQLYHLIDDNHEEIKLENDISNYMIDD